MLLRLLDHFTAAVGVEKALEDAKGRLAAAEARLASLDRSSPMGQGQSVSGWLKQCRSCVEDVATCKARVDALARVADGEAPGELPAIDAEARDRQVILMAVAEGSG